MSIPTRRLIAATAELDPASRAMLNLWLHRGLSDAQIADFIGATPEGVAARREALVDALSIELDVAPEEVHETVDQLAGRRGGQAGSGAVPAETGAVSPAERDKSVPSEESESAAPAQEPTVTDPGSVAPPGPAESEAAEPTEAPDGAGAPAVGHRRRLPWTVLLIVALSLLALLLLVSVLLTGPGRSSPAPKSARSVHPVPRARTGPAPSSAVPRRAPAARTPTALRLRPVPGAAPTGTGVATLSRRAGATRLHLVVRGLAPLRRATVYGVWLYNSVLDVAPLAVLLRPMGTADVRLPRTFRRYRFIDVSVQRVTSYFHSGQSVLRAPL